MHGERAWTRCGPLAVAVALLAFAAPAVASPPAPVDLRLRDTVVATGVTAPTAIRVAADGRLVVAEKGGRVKVFDHAGDTTPTVVVDLRNEVHDFWDRGLLGMALDPEFVFNGRLYLMYAKEAGWNDACPDPPGATEDGCLVYGKLVRVTLQPLGPPVVQPLIDGQWCQQFPSHSVGTLAFGPDGMLYASAGDGAGWWFDDGRFGSPRNPCGDPAAEGGSLRSQDVETPADPTGLDGTIIRIDPGTGAGVSGSPFASSPDANTRRIVAYGLRNPFRFSFRPGTSEIWLGDVGQDLWEEVNRVPNAADAVAENFAWPCREGPDPLWGWQDLERCSGVLASATAAPRWVYEHGRKAFASDTCSASSGSSIAGVAFGGEAAPPELRGGMFVADFARNCIWGMPAGTGGLPDPTQVEVVARGTPGSGPVDLQLGPDGSLYYAYYSPNNSALDAIHKLTWDPGRPVARIVTTPELAAGPAPLDVSFDGRGSTDPDGDIDDLVFAWDLDGDGAFDDATGKTPDWRYEEPGDVEAALRVRDVHGEEDITSVTVRPGNTPPEARIVGPAATTHWAVGDDLAPVAEVSDAQDGELPADRIAWSVSIEHCPPGVTGCHSHPLQSLAGEAPGTFPAPDHGYPSALVVRVTATDSGGLTATEAVRLEPRTAQLNVATEPPGLHVRVNDLDGTAPFTRTVIAGSRTSLAAITPQESGGVTWLLRDWTDGVVDPFRTVVVAADAGYTARFAPADVAGGGTPPPAEGGPAPSPEPPPRLRLRLGGRRVQSKPSRVVVLADCGALRCRVTVRPTLMLGRARRLGSVARTVPAGRTVKLVVHPRGHALARARRALRAGRRVKLRVAARAMGLDGAEARAERTVVLRRQ
jgi:glucose/arabinose dehydrogenase